MADRDRSNGEQTAVTECKWPSIMAPNETCERMLVKFQFQLFAFRSSFRCLSAAAGGKTYLLASPDWNGFL